MNADELQTVDRDTYAYPAIRTITALLHILSTIWLVASSMILRFPLYEYNTCVEGHAKDSQKCFSSCGGGKISKNLRSITCTDQITLTFAGYVDDGLLILLVLRSRFGDELLRV